MRFSIKVFGFSVLIALAAFGNLFPGQALGSDGKTAIICFLEGKAWKWERGEKDRQAVRLFDWIEVGSIIETDPGARLILAFSNGDRYELGKSTRVTIGQAEFTSRNGTINKLAAVPVMPQIVSFARESKPGTRLGGIRLRTLKRTISGLYPNEGEAVLADNAVLVFEPLEGVGKYRVEIEDEAGNNIFSVETTTPRTVIPPGVIKPGANYYWQVRTLEKDKLSTVSYAAFATVSDEQARVRNAFKAQVAQSKDAANLLLLAQMEMALGLRREACETLQEALALFPDNAEIKNAMAQIGCK
jgi:hypothetical protein